MQVRPQDRAVHAEGNVEHVVMIVPVDPEIDEAQHVGQELRQHRAQRGEIGSLRCLQLEHHDRDDDRDHAIAERFEPARFHLLTAPIAATAYRLANTRKYWRSRKPCCTSSSKPAAAISRVTTSGDRRSARGGPGPSASGRYSRIATRPPGRSTCRTFSMYATRSSISL